MFNKKAKLPISQDLFTSLISGSEAGIATTAAIIAGILISTDDRALVTTSAIVAILVQAFNSSINLIYTAHTVDEIENNHDKDSLLAPMIQAGLQFLTHMFNGILVLLPIIYVIDLGTALIISMTISLVLLTLTGYIVGKTVNHTPILNSVHSLTLGALIIAGGYAAGLLAN